MAYAEVEELVRVLRLRAPTAEQQQALARVLDAAALEIDSEVGTSYMGTTFPSAQAEALIVEVNLERAVEHWNQEEAPFGIVGLGDTVPVSTARDSWERHAHKLAPLRVEWPIA